MCTNQRSAAADSRLTRAHAPPGPAAHRLLSDYADAKGDKVEPVYFLAGRKKGGDGAHATALAPAASLESTKASLEQVSSVHVYSVQVKVTEAQALHDVDEESRVEKFEQPTDIPNALRNNRCAATRRRLRARAWLTAAHVSAGAPWTSNSRAPRAPWTRAWPRSPANRSPPSPSPSPSPSGSPPHPPGTPHRSQPTQSALDSNPVRAQHFRHGQVGEGQVQARGIDGLSEQQAAEEGRQEAAVVRCPWGSLPASQF